MDAPPPASHGPDDPDGPIDELDQRLLDDLAHILDELDPMPAGLVERARFAVALEEVEVEVAQLLSTATESDTALAGVRGDNGDLPLTMTFAADDVTVTLAVTDTGRDVFRVDGWLTNGTEVEVTLRMPGDSRTQPVGPDGRFVFEAVPPGMVQVIVASSADDRAVVTPVFEL